MSNQASLGIAEIIIMALVKQNMTEVEALDRVWLVDSKGLVVKVFVFAGVGDKFYCAEYDFFFKEKSKW
jgi:hypothetical protein